MEIMHYDPVSVLQYLVDANPTNTALGVLVVFIDSPTNGT
jgi:hypothetical protein